MNNFFITKTPFKVKENPPLVHFINRGLNFLKIRYALQPRLNPMDMTNIEIRMNYFLLIESVVANNIEGDVIELGCYTGQCALIFQKVIQMYNSEKQLHLFDSFEVKFGFKGSVEDELKNNFKNAGLTQPILHKGYFQDTIPLQLPEKIAFAHIDCGFGGDALQHKEVMLHCLESIYPRMTKGSICVLMDYHDKTSDNPGWDLNPGVKMACDEFFASRPEKIVSLYANVCPTGFFRKL